MTKLADDLEALAAKATPGPFVRRGKNVLLAGGGKWEATFEAGADRDIFEFCRSNHAAIITALREVDRLREALSGIKDDDDKIRDAATMVCAEARRIDGVAAAVAVPRELIGLLRISLAMREEGEKECAALEPHQ